MSISMEVILARQLDSVDKASFAELRDKYYELFGSEADFNNICSLKSRVAYRLQEMYRGGVSEEDLKILSDIADQDSLANLLPESAKTTLKGTRLKRIWKGIQYEAVVVGDGTYEMNGEKYKSLSAIARRITGTQWNGKIFFGVK